MATEKTSALWNQARKLLSQKEETNNPTAEAYLDYLIPMSLDDNDFIFATRLSVAKQWIEAHYLSYIADALALVLEYPRKISILIQEDTPVSSSTPNNDSSSTFNNIPKSTSSINLNNTVNGVPHNFSPIPPVNLNTDNSFKTNYQDTNRGTSLVISSDEPLISQVAPAFHHLPITENAASPINIPVDPSNVPIVAPITPSPSQKTFDSFVVGDSNNFAFAAAQGVAELPGQRFNPLFIHGRSGLGKTHILLAIKEFINRYHPNKKVIYAPTSVFVDDFTSAMASVTKDLTDFRYKYYSCDVLLLDDVQILEGKESTTNVLFDIFNIFIAQEKQIVLSADRAPNELALDERYTSRFAQGLTAGIQPPNFEMKMAIFTNFERYYCTLVGKSDIKIPHEVATHIIELSGSNIRELEGAAQSVCFAIASRKDSNQSVYITKEEAEQIVGKVFLRGDNKKVPIKAIQQEIEQYFNVSHSDIIGPQRSKNITYPRQVAMYLSRRLTDKSLNEIGDMFGGKDHTTVLYACNNIESKYMKDAEKKMEIERLAERIMQ